MPLARRTAISTLVCAALLGPAAAAADAGPALQARYRADATKVQARIALGSIRTAKPPVARVAQQDCPDADLEPTGGNEPQIRAAILCLHNQIRAQRGLPLLHENVKLRRAAIGQSNDMVTRRFFDHTTPDGVTMVDRITRARYVNPRVGWSLGENLAWGTGDLGTPRGVMNAWMNSPGHRANILKRSYREVGIGIATG
ncbi:MAG: hypothetical protein QOE28_294, partial [Solirubrobacteraceae bacterium]|nr:hypothetical protein [Solirubrobacteraceae bacterium]